MNIRGQQLHADDNYGEGAASYSERNVAVFI